MNPSYLGLLIILPSSSSKVIASRDNCITEAESSTGLSVQTLLSSRISFLLEWLHRVIQSLQQCFPLHTFPFLTPSISQHTYALQNQPCRGDSPERQNEANMERKSWEAEGEKRKEKAPPKVLCLKDAQLREAKLQLAFCSPSEGATFRGTDSPTLRWFFKQRLCLLTRTFCCCTQRCCLCCCCCC